MLMGYTGTFATRAEGRLPRLPRYKRWYRRRLCTIKGANCSEGPSKELVKYLYNNCVIQTTLYNVNASRARLSKTVDEKAP